MYDSPILTSLSLYYNVSVSAVILSWLVQRGIIPVPHSATRTRVVENIHLVSLTEEQVVQINNLHKSTFEKRLIDACEQLADGLWFNTPGKGRTFYGWTVQDMGWEDQNGNSLI